MTGGLSPRLSAEVGGYAERAAADGAGRPPDWGKRAAVHGTRPTKAEALPAAPARPTAPLWLRRALVATLTSPAPAWAARRWGLGLGARRYVAGPALEDAMGVVRRLGATGMGASLNLLGEGSPGAAGARSAAQTYREALERLRGEGLDAGLSVKPSQFGARGGEAGPALRAVLEAAAAAGRFVWLDMEGSAHTSATVDLAIAARAAGLPAGVCLQAYLRRTPDDLRRVDAAGVPVRLVKGAYAETPAVAYAKRTEIDRAFAGLVEERLRAGRFTAVATHDERMLRHVLGLASSGARRDAFELQFLYGIRPQRQRELAAEGWPVRVYVPFGPDWYPYFVRRIAERPANLLLLVGDLAAWAVRPRRRAAPVPADLARERRRRPWYRPSATKR